MASCAGEMRCLITLTSFQSVVRIYPGNWDGCKRKQKSHRQAHMQSHVLLALNDGDGKTNSSQVRELLSPTANNTPWSRSQVVCSFLTATAGCLCKHCRYP